MATEEVVWERSALPISSKTNILLEEMGRRLKNCDLDTPWEEKTELISKFNVAMKKAGHMKRFRHMVTIRVFPNIGTALISIGMAEP